MNSSTISPMMDETLQYIYTEIIENYIPEYIRTIEFEYTPWVFSLIGAAIIGLSGILPLLVIPVQNEGMEFKDRKCFCLLFHFFFAAEFIANSYRPNVG